MSCRRSNCGLHDAFLAVSVATRTGKRHGGPAGPEQARGHSRSPFSPVLLKPICYSSAGYHFEDKRLHAVLHVEAEFLVANQTSPHRNLLKTKDSRSAGGECCTEIRAETETLRQILRVCADLTGSDLAHILEFVRTLGGER